MTKQLLTYKKLRTEFDQKVKTLQEDCPHRHLTKWVEIWYSLGHSTGARAKYCKRCELQVKKRVSIARCSVCSHEQTQYISPCGKCEGELKYVQVERNLVTGKSKDLKVYSK